MSIYHRDFNVKKKIKYLGPLLPNRLTPITPHWPIVMKIWFNHPDVKNLAITLPKTGVELGCNWFYTIRPQIDHVVSYDPNTRDQITADTKDTKNTFYTFWTKNGHRTEQFQEVCYPARVRPEDSGTLAVYLAIKYFKAKEILILGCGWGKASTESLFDHRYTHRKTASKVSNPKLKLLRLYQDEFKVPITFAATEIFDRNFCFVDPASLSPSSS